MQLDILKNEEKRTNFVMLLFYAVIPPVAFLYVLLFNGGAWKDSIVLLMALAGLLVKLLEKPLGKNAKYLYVSILPVFGAVTIIMGTPGAFGAMAEAYFLFCSSYRLKRSWVDTVSRCVSVYVYIVYLDIYHDGICVGGFGGSDDCHEGARLV